MKLHKPPYDHSELNSQLRELTTHELLAIKKEIQREIDRRGRRQNHLERFAIALHFPNWLALCEAIGQDEAELLFSRREAAQKHSIMDLGFNP